MISSARNTLVALGALLLLPLAAPANADDGATPLQLAKSLHWDNVIALLK